MLRVFNSGVQGKIFGPKKDEVKDEWRKLLNEELNDLYCSPKFVRVIKSRRMSLAGYMACMGERRGAYRLLVGRCEGKRQISTTQT